MPLSRDIYSRKHGLGIFGARTFPGGAVAGDACGNAGRRRPSLQMIAVGVRYVPRRQRDAMMMGMRNECGWR